MPLIKVLGRRKLLLDTHVWIWYLQGNSALTAPFLQAAKRALSENRLYISPISVWEFGMLVEKKRIELDLDRLEWVEQAINQAGVEIAALTPRIAIQSTRLSGNPHGDPADRMLISTAHEFNAVLVTCDQALLEYGKERYIHVYDPTRKYK